MINLTFQPLQLTKQLLTLFQIEQNEVHKKRGQKADFQSIQCFVDSK